MLLACFGSERFTLFELRNALYTITKKKETLVRYIVLYLIS